MSIKSQRPVFVALVAITMLGAAATDGAAASPRIAICYNRTTHVLRYSPHGHCPAGLSLVVVGKGIVGARGPGGPRGLAGIHGVAGPRGDVGSAGSNGAPGIDGGQGPAGVQGPAGGTGLQGGTGSGGGTGLQGGTGPQGGTGGPGVNVSHIVVTAPATAGPGTLVAECAAGDVVTGGGFQVDPALGLVTIKASYPTAGGTQWSVVFSSGTSVSVTAYAICATGTTI